MMGWGGLGGPAGWGSYGNPMGWGITWVKVNRECSGGYLRPEWEH